MSLISFDFDDTLTVSFPDSRARPNWAMIDLLRLYARLGHMVVVVTYRCKDNEDRGWIAANDPYRVVISEFIAEHNLPVDTVYFTNHTDKGPILALLGAAAHYDDDEAAIGSAEVFGVRAVRVTPGEDREWEPLDL